MNRNQLCVNCARTTMRFDLSNDYSYVRRSYVNQIYPNGFSSSIPNEITLSIGLPGLNVYLSHSLRIVEVLSSPVHLGLDFLRKQQAYIEYPTQLFYIQGIRYPFSMTF